MRRILNLTQHMATAEQVAEGVVEPLLKDYVKECLTFEKLPTKEVIFHRASLLVKVAKESNCDSVMIGGAPYLMPYLDMLLSREGYMVLYSFSKRVSVEHTLEDGTVEKTQVFKHIGFC